MSGSGLEDLPPDVARLLAREREVPPAPESARARVAARLGLVAAVPPPAPTRGWLAGVKVAIVLVAVVGGAAWMASRRAPEVAVAPTPVREGVITVASARHVPRPVPPVAPAAHGPAETEIAVLLRARRALADRDPARALTALERHRRRWPAGELVQEREVLAIQALVLTGAHDPARRRADAFLIRFPSSTLAATVRQLREGLRE